MHVSGRLNMNDGAALLDAALLGAGIATVATFLAADAVRSGRLRYVLPEYAEVGPAVWLEYLERRHLSSRMRAFVDYLVQQVPIQTLDHGIPGPVRGADPDMEGRHAGAIR